MPSTVCRGLKKSLSHRQRERTGIKHKHAGIKINVKYENVLYTNGSLI